MGWSKFRGSLRDEGERQWAHAHRSNRSERGEFESEGCVGANSEGVCAMRVSGSGSRREGDPTPTWAHSRGSNSHRTCSNSSLRLKLNSPIRVGGGELESEGWVGANSERVCAMSVSVSGRRREGDPTPTLTHSRCSNAHRTCSNSSLALTLNSPIGVGGVSWSRRDGLEQIQREVAR